MVIMTGGARDGVATLCVAAIAVPYIGYLVRGEMPFIQDPRGMSATGLVLGLVAFVVAARDMTSQLRSLLEVLAGVTLLVGVAALVLAETVAAEALLAVFMGGILLTWLFAMSRYLLGAGRGSAATRPL
jgi:hypothetical protein